jgi:hypothetical protein
VWFFATLPKKHLQTHHAPRSAEHQVGMRSFCGSYDFLCRAAVNQQGMDRQAAMRHNLPYAVQRPPPALLSRRNQRWASQNFGRRSASEYAIAGGSTSSGRLPATLLVRSALEQSCAAKRARIRPRKGPADLLRAPGRSSSSAADQTEHGTELSTPSRD